MGKDKWIIYTVAIGLLPFIIRCAFYFISNGLNVEFIMSESDFVIFGLVLNLTNLNELEHREASIWKTRMIGLSIMQVAFYSAILILSYITEIEDNVLINEDVLFYFSLAVALVSFILSYTIINKINEVADGND